MDIPAKKWELGKLYEVDDIVKIGNLAVPDGIDIDNPDESGGYLAGNEFKIITDGGEFVITDGNFYLISDVLTKGDLFSKKTFTESEEINFGFFFPVNPSIGYTVKTMVKKAQENSTTIDPYNTRVNTINGEVDVNSSIGVGVGIKFYDENNQEVLPNNQRSTKRLMACDELSHLEYYNVQLDLHPEVIPANAVVGSVVVFIYGLKSGGFTFKDVEATTLSKFFYCTKDHKSSNQNFPGPTTTEYWTQDFHWRPSYGSTSSFAAINDYIKMAEGSDHVNNLALNSLPMELDVRFNNRTDKQAKAIMHFLQEKHFAYQSIFGLDYKGNRLLSSEVASFNFIYTNPYRKDLKFICSNFTHNISYRNNNAISAKFSCATESITRSVESHAGFNERLDVYINLYIDEKTHFKKGEKITLNTFSLKEEEIDENGNVIKPGLKNLGAVEYIEVSSRDQTNKPILGKIKFREKQDLTTMDCISIKTPKNEGSIFNLIKTNIRGIIDEYTFIFGSLNEDGNEDGIENTLDLETDINQIFESDSNLIISVEDPSKDIPIEVKKFTRCPEDCLSNKPFFPEGVDEIDFNLKDPQTGEDRPRIVFLKNYRQFQLASPVKRGDFTVDLIPLSDFTLEAEEDIELLIPAVRGRHSIYLEDPNRIPKYQWAKVRNFEQRPSLTFTLKNTPTNIETKFIKYYKKAYKKEVNQNMSTFTVVFGQRDDEEALEILQFLESHLGSKKFRFTMPRPYLSDDDILTTQAKKYSSVFFCPSWNHEVVYKNNHKITATFIESATSLYEDLSDINNNLKGPCYSAAAFNKITNHELCTFSSAAQAVLCDSTFDLLGPEGNLGGNRKAVDIVFVVDTTGSMTHLTIQGEGPDSSYQYSKYKAAVDLVMKMVTSHDQLIMPGTFDYGGHINAPEISSTLPPWPVDESLNTLIDPTQKNIREDLKSKGYNLEELERFTIKVERDRVNFGLILMGEGVTVNDISSHPESFDKKIFYDQALDWRNTNARYGQGEYFTDAVSKALAQLYNSPRAEFVSDRIIIMLSDGVITAADASIDGSIWDRYSQPTLNMAEQLRKGGELSKRRPSDSVLGKSSYSHAGNSPLSKINTYSSQNNPDGENNPAWYEEEVPTIFMFAQMGNSNYMSKHNKKYVYDYDENSSEDPEFFFKISDNTNPADEVARLLALIKTVSRITSETGYENLFCVSVKNCGPRPIKILNTLINLENEPADLKWTTSVLESGIPKDGNYRDIIEIEPEYNIVNIKTGYGGQFYGDLNNKSFLQEDAFGEGGANTLWESFNTEYEVIRGGEVFEINGGWNSVESYTIITDQDFKIQLDDGSILMTDPILIIPPKTRGVYNTGVAFRGMPIRIFKTTSGLEIVDYNIGGVDLTKWEQEDQEGNYNHLPELQPEEYIDLFFGLRIGNLASLGDRIELVFNTEDDSLKKMDCYARLEIPIKIGDIESEAAPTGEPLNIPDFSSLVGVGINFDCPTQNDAVNQWLEWNSRPENFEFLNLANRFAYSKRNQPAGFNEPATEENVRRYWGYYLHTSHDDYIDGFYAAGLSFDDYDTLADLPYFKDGAIVAPSIIDQMEILHAWGVIKMYFVDGVQPETSPNYPWVAKYGMEHLLELEGRDGEIAGQVASSFWALMILGRSLNDNVTAHGIKPITEAKRLLGISGSSSFLADNPVPASDWVELTPVNNNLANGTVTLATHEGDLGVGMNWELRANGDFNVNGSSMGSSFGDPANVTWPGWLDSWRNQNLPANIVKWNSSSNYSECDTSWSGF